MKSFTPILQNVGFYLAFIKISKFHHQPCVKLNILVSHRVHFAVWGFAPPHFSARVSDLKGLKFSSHSMEWVMLPAAPSEELPPLMREKEQTMNNSAFLSYTKIWGDWWAPSWIIAQNWVSGDKQDHESMNNAKLNWSHLLVHVFPNLILSYLIRCSK